MTKPFDARAALASGAAPFDPLRETVRQRPWPLGRRLKRLLLFAAFCLVAYPCYAWLWHLQWVASGSPSVMAVWVTPRQLGPGAGLGAAILLWRRESRPFGSRALLAGIFGVTAVLAFRLCEYGDAAAHARPEPGWYRAFVEESRAGSAALSPSATVGWSGRSRSRSEIVLSEELRRRLVPGRTCLDLYVTEPTHGFIFVRFARIHVAANRAPSASAVARRRTRCFA